MWQIYRDHFQLKVGLTVKDDRCIARLANIKATGESNLFDEDNLIKLLNRMPGAGRTKGTAIYCNEAVLSQMEIKLKDKSNVHYAPGKGEGLAGEPIMTFRGGPREKGRQNLQQRGPGGITHMPKE